MAIHAVRQPPTIPGWIVRDDGTTYTASPLDDLTDYQLEHGCLPEVTGTSAKAVEILCIAQIIAARMVSDAEQAEWAEVEHARAAGETP